MSLIPVSNGVFFAGLALVFIIFFGSLAYDVYSSRMAWRDAVTEVSCLTSTDTATGRVRSHGLFGPRSYTFVTTDGRRVSVGGPCRIEAIR